MYNLYAMHVSRAYDGPDPVTATCPCIKAACGLAVSDSSRNGCDTHDNMLGEDFEQYHLAYDCGGND